MGPIAGRILALALVILGAARPGSGPVAMAQERPASPGSLFDPRLGELRKATVAWDARRPERQVIDQICLVPDLPTFLEAIAAWDRKTFFPILIEDGEYTPKFVRAFRPARIVRYRGKMADLPPGRLWDAAQAAVGRAWADQDAAGKAPSGGVRPPRELGPTPPGLVFSEPNSPSLAGAVALAAGRFQPLLRWSPGKSFGETLSPGDAEALARDIENLATVTTPRYRGLGDDCDFLTLAGDYPFRYNSEEPPYPGPRAFDDLAGRESRPAGPNQPRARWAYTGRLMGGPVASAYRAMCSLFLQPDSAILFNSYSDTDAGFKDYTQRPADATLARLMTTTTWWAPDRNNLGNWHHAFSPRNEAGLLVVNSSGGATTFNIPGGPGQTGDVPATCPAAIHIIHSYSAHQPTDPNTLAGRWLANGAYLYYGSMEEPYLQSFRTPTLVAALLADHIPFAAAVRMMPAEAGPFGNPWRLVVLGDPLYRLETPPNRLPNPGKTASADWPAYRREAAPPAKADVNARFAWAVKSFLLGGQADAPKGAREAATEALAGLPRDQLPANLRPLLDAFAVEALFQAKRPAEVVARLVKLPRADRNADVQRWLETARVTVLYQSLDGGRWDEVVALWGELIRSESPPELKIQLTRRIGPLADSTSKAGLWAGHLRTALKGAEPPLAPVLEAELKRITEAPYYKEATPDRGGQE